MAMEKPSTAQMKEKSGLLGKENRKIRRRKESSHNIINSKRGGRLGSVLGETLTTELRGYGLDLEEKESL